MSFAAKLFRRPLFSDAWPVFIISNQLLSSALGTCPPAQATAEAKAGKFQIKLFRHLEHFNFEKVEML